MSAGQITAIATLLGVVWQIVLAVIQMRRSKDNAEKIDHNTRLTEEVHDAVAGQTGTQKALDP